MALISAISPALSLSRHSADATAQFSLGSSKQAIDDKVV
jgi:hypothetical protein